MGDPLTEDRKKDQTGPQTYGDIFDELFPHYLVMGMTPEEYWDGESSLKPAFRKAYKIRNENARRIEDQNNWYLGIYIRKALQSSLLLVNGFVPKGAHPEDYPEKPFTIQEEEKRQEEAKKKNEEQQMMLAMAMLQAKFEQFNRRFEQQPSGE